MTRADLRVEHDLRQLIFLLNEVDAAVDAVVQSDVVRRAGADLSADDDETLPEPGSSGYVNEPGATALAESGATVEPGTDVSDWTTTWGGAGGGMYSTLADLGAWAASGFGTDQLSAELGEQRLSSTKDLPEVLGYGLGIANFGDGWIGHAGQIVGWESLALYNVETGAVLVGATNETGSLTAVVEAMVIVDPELATVLS